MLISRSPHPDIGVPRRQTRGTADADGKWYNDVIVIAEEDTGVKEGDMLTAVVTVDGVYQEQDASGKEIIVPRFELLFVDKIE